MQLKVSSPEKLIFQGEVEQINLPSETWEVSILPNHAPMVLALKPWLIKITPKGNLSKSEFVFSKDVINISVSKWMAFTDGKLIRVVTSVATTDPKQSEKTLDDIKNKLKKEIGLLKQKGSLEEVEKSLIKLEKINADILLSKIKKQPRTA